MTADTTKERIEEIRGLSNAATEGPWNCFIKGDVIAIGANFVDQIVHWSGFDACKEPLFRQRANAKFIAEARTIVPELLDLVTRLTEERDGLKRDFFALGNENIELADANKALTVQRDAMANGLKQGAAYLRQLDENLRTHDADMLIAICLSPESVADMLDAALSNTGNGGGA